MDIIEEFHSFEEIVPAGEPTVSGNISIAKNFPDPEGLLETAYAFLLRLKSFPLKVTLCKGETSTFEEYILESGPGKIRITAGDTEGIRRGIYKTGELLRQFTPEALPRKKEVFTPKFKIRIGRYRFGTHSCPGSRSELDEGTDCYPEGFLDRLASEGINTLWFNAPFYKNFFLSKWTPENPEKKKAMYAQLQKNVDKCRRYGIRIIPYHVLPQFWSVDDPLIEEHKELAGPLYCGRRHFCIHTKGKEFLYDLFHELFSSVKNLGGFLAIVEGEGASVCPEMLQYGPLECQEKCGLKPEKIFAEIIAAMYNGMRSARKDAELIAWFYMPYAKHVEDYLEYAMAEGPEGVIYQYNAESGAELLQLGKKRNVWDYWQCVTEPAPCFKKFSSMAKRQKRRCSAKIQVGTSHEVGSIPYVPVPALLYRKYRNLQALGVTDVMQVWGTGGTPGLMNYAAGYLAFTDCSRIPEEEFLLSLGKIWWGEELAPQAAKAWKILSDAYETNYPYSNMIQYFGPVADGVNWPLYAYPVYKPLLPTWSLNQGEISGDNIWDCLENHTLSEAAFLCMKLYEEWHKGCELFREMTGGKKLTFIQERELVRMEALEAMFGSAGRIFRFYELRQMVFDNKDTTPVPEMRAIVHSEIENRRRLQKLILKDDVLGYNPEASGYKYDADTIEKGLSHMEKTLEDLKRIEKGDLENPIHFASALLDGQKIRRKFFTWSGTVKEDILHIKVDFPGHYKVRDEIFITFDSNGHSWISRGHYDSSSRAIFAVKGGTTSIVKGEDGWQFNLSIPVKELPGGNFDNLRLNILRVMDSSENMDSWPGKDAPRCAARLNMAFYDPLDMGFIKKP